MNESPPIPAAIAAVPSLAEVKATGPGELHQRHLDYATKFDTWLRGLNRADFMQAKKLLDAMIFAYAKHTMKIHSPPMREADNDVPSKTSDGAPDMGVPPEGGAA